MRYLLYGAVFLLVGYLLTGVTQVRPGERGVVRRFGRVVETPGPGLHVGLPWGFERVDRVPVDQVQRLQIGYRSEEEDEGGTPTGQLLTGDQNLVNVQAVLDYAVRDAEVEQYLINADRIESLLSRTAESVLAEWVAGRTVDEVLIRGKAALSGVLVARVTERLRPFHLGIDVQAASVTQLLPPADVKDSFDSVTRAQASMRTREHQARSEADRTRGKSLKEKAELARASAAYVHDRLARAHTEAAAFEKELAHYQKVGSAGEADYLSFLWWREMGRLFQRMKENGRVEVLDEQLGGDELDITMFLPGAKKK